MENCAECGVSDSLLFNCSHCGELYCPDHNSMINHGCPNLENSESLEPGTEDIDEQSDPAESSKQWINLTVWIFGITVIVAALAGGYILTGYGFNDGQPNLLGPLNPGPSAADINETFANQQVHNRINQQRDHADRSELLLNSTLSDVASSHSQDMAEKGYTNHTGPSGETVADRYERFDLQCPNIGEVILYTHYDKPLETPNETVRYTTEGQLASGIVDSLMSSPQHRQAILNPSWKHVGIGIAMDDTNKVYVTVNFC